VSLTGTVAVICDGKFANGKLAVVDPNSFIKKGGRSPLCPYITRSTLFLYINIVNMVNYSASFVDFQVTIRHDSDPIMFVATAWPPFAAAVSWTLASEKKERRRAQPPC
jgi:hypothetical protein